MKARLPIDCMVSTANWLARFARILAGADSPRLLEQPVVTHKAYK